MHTNWWIHTKGIKFFFVVVFSINSSYFLTKIPTAGVLLIIQHIYLCYDHDFTSLDKQKRRAKRANALFHDFDMKMRRKIGLTKEVNMSHSITGNRAQTKHLEKLEKGKKKNLWKFIGAEICRRGKSTYSLLWNHFDIK